ncbi:MAG: transcription elongation factor subunit Spt4 [Candidatus Hadarchaeales archaeon]
MSEKACRNCHSIFEGTTCPICRSSSTSDDWSGYVVVLDPTDSRIAKRLNINKPGRYALRVR